MSNNMTDSEDVTRFWEESPHLIRKFIEVRPLYEQLCNEVEYILKKRLNESAIEYSTVTSRAKTLKSFAEKLSRKEYEDPLHEATDLAGVRIVFLYKTDRRAIERIIEDEFDIIEKVDKVEGLEEDRFGYGALHYLVHLGDKYSGARYDDLKNLICEIQVRTVLQDAWAIIDHHLIYKQESDVPKILKRKLNSLSGLFETADDQFDRIRDERNHYRDSVKSKLDSKNNFLNQELNLDTLTEYLKWKFPSIKVMNRESVLSRHLAALLRYGHTRLTDLDSLIERTKDARTEMNKDKPSFSATGELGRALAFERPQYRLEGRWNEKSRSLFKKYEGLLAKKPS